MITKPNSQPLGKQRSQEDIRKQNDAAAMQRLFLVKKHDATRLHYDLRLSHGGVLKSWAVPDGPSYFSGDEREAIQVPDHNRENASFEGVIPEGHYGAGTVMLWDWGTWEPLPGYTDIDGCLRDGLLKLTLNGEKLMGTWALTRLRRYQGNRRNPVWIFTKEQDSFARDKSAKNILEEAPNSVSTRRSLEEISEEWNHGKGENELQGKLFNE
jgi:bifunctional non-homologous end joining protein LigD